jgi:hypothetical protein
MVGVTLGVTLIVGVTVGVGVIVTDMSRCRYADSVLITKGDIRTIKFTEPEE